MTLVTETENLHCSLAECLDALGAQHLFDLAAVLPDGHLLEIGFELPVGGPLREGAVVAESGRFAAVCTFSHS